MSDTTIPVNAIKGRGAATRLAHRFERDTRDAYDDGWGTLEEGEAERPAVTTQVTFENAKSALSHNDSPTSRSTPHSTRTGVVNTAVSTALPGPPIAT